MRKHLSSIGLVMLLAACARTPTPAPVTAIAPPVAPTRDARSAAVSEVVNIVEARAAEAAAFAPVTPGYVLGVGGQVQTGTASKARLDFSDGTIVRLAQSSSFIMNAITPSDQGLAARLQLEAGKIWVSLTGGSLNVETPVGVATVRGSFAVISYNPGNPNNPDDDLLVLDCLEGACTAQNDNIHAQLGNLERVALNRLALLRQTLTSAEVQDFLQNNPESQGLIATLTAAPPATDTPAPTATLTPRPSPTAPATHTPTQTPAPTSTASLTPLSTATALVLRTPVPSAPIIGTHIVRGGETLFCIGRAYGVLPNAIAQVNGLAAPFNLVLDQALRIPANQWVDIAPGPVCPPQFLSPFPGLVVIPTATPTSSLPPTITFTPTATCEPGSFFDPFQKRCRPPDTPVTPSLTGTVPPPTFTPSPTGTMPPPTFTPTATPDTTGPSITNLAVSPTTVGPPSSCAVTFTADITDPSGVSSAQVNWTAVNTASQTTTGTVTMTVVSAIQWSAGWTVTFSPSFPYYGTVSWSVTATDGLGNQSTVASVTTITAQPSSGCP
jgi:LysM repeat protein